MNEMNPPAMVQSIVSNDERVGELIRESRSVDGMLGTDLRNAADKTAQRGQLLLKAQQLCGKGNWRQFLKDNWPDLNERTCRRYIAQATADNLSALRSHTHKFLDDKEEPEESVDPETTPLTTQERKVLVSLIASVKPALAKKLREGTKIYTDEQLKAAAPVSCSKCVRLGWPGGKPCDFCTMLRKGRQGELFEESQEPANPDDPASAPVPPPPDPLIELEKLTKKLASMYTNIAADHAELYRALTACSLMDHQHGKTPKFLALAGVAKVVAIVRSGEVPTDEKIKQAYQGACGTWVPEYVRHARAKKAMRGNK